MPHSVAASIHQINDRINMSRRSYDNTKRAVRAALTRRRIVDSAIELFSANGYTATRMVDLAARAGVSLDTVNANGPKPALLQAAIEVASFGQEGEQLVFAFDLGQRMARAASAREFADVLADGLWELNQRVGALWAILVVEARTNDDLRHRLDSMLASIVRSGHAALDLCSQRGWLTGSLSREQQVVTLLTAGSPDSQHRAVAAGLDAAGYRLWLARVIVTVLGGTDDAGAPASLPAR